MSNVLEERRAPTGDEPARREEEHPFGLHWLAYAALVGIPIGFFQSDLAGLPGPDFLWEAIWVVVIAVAALAVRVVKRRRDGEDPSEEFRNEVDAADARHRGRTTLARGGSGGGSGDATS